MVTGADFPDGRRTTAFFGTALSPDGSKVAYVRTAEATDRELYLSPISGGRPVRLDYGVTGSIPAWSPDSRKLAMLLFQNGSPRLAVVEPGTGDGPKWLPGACRTAPAWSPDGKWIACGSSATHSLLLVSPDGAVTRPVGNLSDVDSSNFGLTWTRDSARVLVASSDRGSARLSSVDIRTGARSLIADYGDTFRFQATTTYTLVGSLMPSGKSVLFTTLTQRTEISMAEGFPDPRTLH